MNKIIKKWKIWGKSDSKPDIVYFQSQTFINSHSCDWSSTNLLISGWRLTVKVILLEFPCYILGYRDGQKVFANWSGKAEVNVVVPTQVSFNRWQENPWNDKILKTVFWVFIYCCDVYFHLLLHCEIASSLFQFLVHMNMNRDAIWGFMCIVDKKLRGGSIVNLHIVKESLI